MHRTTEIRRRGWLCRELQCCAIARNSNTARREYLSSNGYTLSSFDPVYFFRHLSVPSILWDFVDVISALSLPVSKNGLKTYLFCRCYTKLF